MSERRKTAFWSIIGILITGIVVYFALKYFDDLEAFLISVGVFGPLVSLGLYALLSITPVNTDSLTLVNGLVYGVLAGTLIASVGNTVAALIEYYVGLKVRDVSGTEGQTFTVPVIKKKFPVRSWVFLIFGRFIPGYGGKAVSIIAGMYKVPVWKYVWTAFVANAIGAFMFAYGGFLLRNLVI